MLHFGVSLVALDALDALESRTAETAETAVSSAVSAGEGASACAEIDTDPLPYPSGSRSARLRTILGLENPKMIFCHGVICLSLTKVNSQQPSEFADKIFIMPGSGRFTSSKLS